MNDEELLRRLADVFERYDPVPVGIGADAVRAGALAGSASSALVLVADGDVGGVRGAGGRLLGFAWPGGRLDVQIDAGVRLTGVVSGLMGSLRVRWPDGSRRVSVDSVGRFVVGGLPPGPLSFVLSGSVSPWFVG
jgi:hypothetical protein